MAKIKIKDLPKDKKISKEEMKKVTGGLAILTPLSILQIKPSKSLIHMPGHSMC
ncbi:MAG: hypothetical protein JRG97_12835 [Deltaproteobacteria bacterium]|nr:hypothetical protein [Deltaproteobacteria bacterium]MBW2053350.1 hypothetical protein [Deltaproteobacteria bacterium]MBW2141934.1 hypothetical protein [Deltaproteobacteria bacterium]MBW2324576.1 hypothetical protein [Deltaproteobacteria bacterium]